MPAWSLIFGVAVPVAIASIMVCAALHDLATRTIPNGLSLMVAGTALLAAAGQGRLLGSMLAAGFVLACAALCWRRGWMGGGDVKLLGAITVAVPLTGLPALIAAVAISGGILGLLYLLAARLLRPVPAGPLPRTFIARVLRAERWRISRGGPLPYACAIAAGFFYVAF